MPRSAGSSCCKFPPYGRMERALKMKRLMQCVFLMIIACSAAVSVHYAMELYRTKYTPRYLKGN